MLVREVMSRKPVTVRASTPVKEALALLDRHSITMMPVVSPAGVIVGVVSEADLIREVVNPDVRSHMIPQQRGQTVLPPPHAVVEVMNHQTITVRGDTDLAEAANLLTGTAVQSLPVIDEHHRVIGVISRRDIVRVLARSDDVVEQDVDALFHSLGVDWLVDVRDGVVTVTGPVDARERALAESATSTVPGVVAVTVKNARVG